MQNPARAQTVTPHGTAHQTTNVTPLTQHGIQGPSPTPPAINHHLNLQRVKANNQNTQLSPLRIPVGPGQTAVIVPVIQTTQNRNIAGAT